MNCPVATLEPVLNEWKQHTILFIVAIEERTHVPCFVKLGAGKGNRCCDGFHGVLHEVSRNVPMDVYHTLVSIGDQMDEVPSITLFLLARCEARLRHWALRASRSLADPKVSTTPLSNRIIHARAAHAVMSG